MNIKLVCRTCKSDLRLIGSSDIDKTLVPQPDGTFELDTSEFTCDCIDDDGNLTVPENEAQDHVIVMSLLGTDHILDL